MKPMTTAMARCLNYAENIYEGKVLWGSSRTIRALMNRGYVAIVEQEHRVTPAGRKALIEHRRRG